MSEEYPLTIFDLEEGKEYFGRLTEDSIMGRPAGKTKYKRKDNFTYVKFENNEDYTIMSISSLYEFKEVRQKIELLDYELFSDDIHKNIIPLGYGKKAKVIVRRAFRWQLNGERINNGYESQSAEGLCEERGWEVLRKIGDHIAIVNTDKREFEIDG